MSVQHVVAELALAFPRGGVSPDMVRLYVRSLGDIPEDVLAAAKDELIATRTSPYMPTVAEVRELAIEKMLSLPSETEALEWAGAYAHNVAQGGAPSPPEIVRRALTAVGGAYAWRTTSKPSILRSQFLSTFRDLRDAELRSASLATFSLDAPSRGLPKGGDAA